MMGTRPMWSYQLALPDLRRLRQHPALPGAAGANPESAESAESADPHAAEYAHECYHDYYDTPEAALAQRGLLLARVRSGWDQRFELFSLTAAPQQAQAPRLLAAGHGEHGRLSFAFVPGRKLRQWLDARGAALQPVASERLRREVLTVDTAAGAVTLVLEQVHMSKAGESQACHFGRVHIKPDAGQEQAAHLLSRSLLQSCAMQALAPHPLAQLAAHIEAQGGAAALAGPVRARPNLPEEGAADQAGGPVFQHIARNCLVHLQHNLPGLLYSDAPEYVHQARVAIRRLRSAIKLFAPWLPGEFVTEFSARWRDQANALGDCRNLDVFLAETLPLLQRELGQDALLKRLESQARRAQQQARRQARAAVSSPEARLLQHDFLWALEQLEFPEAMPRLEQLARRRLINRARQVTRLAEAVRDLDPEARHELRIAFKKLRYALEFFTPLFNPRRSRRYLAGLVDLQEVLGHLNDLATAAALVQELLPAAQARLPLAWLAGRVGALVDALPTAVGHFLAAEPPWAPAAKA